MIEEKQVEGDEQIPIGTWVLLVVTAVGMTLTWLFLYFGVFLPRGTVS
jgi:hypothetical protein